MSDKQEEMPMGEQFELNTKTNRLQKKIMMYELEAKERKKASKGKKLKSKIDKSVKDILNKFGVK